MLKTGKQHRSERLYRSEEETIITVAAEILFFICFLYFPCLISNTETVAIWQEAKQTLPSVTLHFRTATFPYPRDKRHQDAHTLPWR